MKIKTVISIEYDELDNIINSFYNRKDFELVAIQEWNNDEDHSITFKKEPLKEWDQKSIDQIKSGGKIPNWCLWTVMQDLVNNDVIPEGEYLIEISW